MYFVGAVVPVGRGGEKYTDFFLKWCDSYAILGPEELNQPAKHKLKRLEGLEAPMLQTSNYRKTIPRKHEPFSSSPSSPHDPYHHRNHLHAAIIIIIITIIIIIIVIILLIIIIIISIIIINGISTVGSKT